jgi:hypothetical protein
MSEQWVDAIYEASGLLVGPEQGRAIGAMIEAMVEAARWEEREAIACDLDCGCPDETKAAVLEALRGGFNSAKRWKACGHSECSAIEAAAIRARGDA